jgi:hypothetical protein
MNAAECIAGEFLGHRPADDHKPHRMRPPLRTIAELGRPDVPPDAMIAQSSPPVPQGSSQ